MNWIREAIGVVASAFRDHRWDPCDCDPPPWSGWRCRSCRLHEHGDLTTLRRRHVA